MGSELSEEFLTSAILDSIMSFKNLPTDNADIIYVKEIISRIQTIEVNSSSVEFGRLTSLLSSMLQNAKKDGFWPAAHRLRSDPLYITTVSKLLSAIIALDPSSQIVKLKVLEFFGQCVTRKMLEKIFLIPDLYRSSKETRKSPTPATFPESSNEVSGDEEVIAHIAGFVFRQARNKFRKFKECQPFLQNSIRPAGDNDVRVHEKWTNKLNRGGLTKVEAKAFMLVTRMHGIAGRHYTPRRIKRRFSLKANATQDILHDPMIKCLWNQLWEGSSASDVMKLKVLMHCITKFLTCRGKALELRLNDCYAKMLAQKKSKKNKEKNTKEKKPKQSNKGTRKMLKPKN